MLVVGLLVGSLGSEFWLLLVCVCVIHRACHMQAYVCWCSWVYGFACANTDVVVLVVFLLAPPPPPSPPSPTDPEGLLRKLLVLLLAVQRLPRPRRLPAALFSPMLQKGFSSGPPFTPPPRIEERIPRPPGGVSGAPDRGQDVAAKKPAGWGGKWLADPLSSGHIIPLL